jgi:3-oxoacyl-[acyl-carrier protein] reductase
VYKIGEIFMNLKGKVALVTGASRGIGKGIALELAKAGACVIINYKSNDEAAEDTIREIKDLGAYALKIKGDVSDYEFSKQMIKTTVEKLGRIDILINNAGISKVGLFMDATPEEWDNVLNINLKGTINCSHSAVVEMIRQKSGSIINISSMWGNVGASCEAIYSASKGAINSFTKALAKELAPCNIRVNAIAPGVIDTEMNRWLNEEERKSLLDEIPMMRFGEVEDIGKLVTFLVSENSKYITGQVITIDGGMQ